MDSASVAWLFPGLLPSRAEGEARQGQAGQSTRCFPSSSCFAPISGMREQAGWPCSPEQIVASSMAMHVSTILALAVRRLFSGIAIRHLSHDKGYAVLLENQSNAGGIPLESLLQLDLEGLLTLAHPHRDVEGKGSSRATAAQRH